MTHRERILAAIRGETPDRLPWVPRLEFWYRARIRQGTLPAGVAISHPYRDCRSPGGGLLRFHTRLHRYGATKPP